MPNARWAGGRDDLNGRVDASTRSGALSSSSTLKRCVDHDPNRASRWTWRTLRANGVRSLAVACLKCRRATYRQRSWCPVVAHRQGSCRRQTSPVTEVLRPFARTSPRIARLDMTDNWRVLTAYEVLSQLPADPDDAMSVVAIVTKSIKKASRPRLQGWRAITANDIMSILPSDTKDARGRFSPLSWTRSRKSPVLMRALVPQSLPQSQRDNAGTAAIDGALGQQRTR